MRRKLKRQRNPITIMLDVEFKKKLLEKQADKIQRTKGHVSFSQVLHDTLKKGLKE